MGRSRAKSTGVVVLHLRGIRSNFSLTAVKRGLLVVTLAFMGAAGYVLAAPSTGETASCGPPDVTLADYVLLGSAGCTIDDKTFSNFAYTSSAHGTGVEVPSSGITVVPDTTPGNPGFTFAGPFTPPPGGETIGRIYFDVRTTLGAALIKDASVNIVAGGTGNFSTTIREFLCLGVSHSPNCNLPTELGRNSSGSDSVNFTPESLVGVDPLLLDVTADPGAGNTAFVTSVKVQFSEVPEPATVALFGTGLLGLAGLRLLRRRR